MEKSSFLQTAVCATEVDFLVAGVPAFSYAQDGLVASAFPHVEDRQTCQGHLVVATKTQIAVCPENRRKSFFVHSQELSLL